MTPRTLKLVLLVGTLNSAMVSPAIALQAKPQSTQPVEPCQQGEATSKGSESSSSSTEKSTQAPCVPEKKEPSAAEKFPFPGSDSAPAMPGAPSAPDAPTPATHRPSAAEEHPFPGSAPPMPGSSSSSSSSSSDDNSPPPDDTPAPAADNHPTGRRRLPKVEKLQSDEERADEDLRVSKFYEDKGDLNAAYLRARDAVKTLPTDSETHYTLARLAQKMNNREEAIAEYGKYLKMDPDGEHNKQVQKALNQLGPN